MSSRNRAIRSHLSGPGGRVPPVTLSIVDEYHAEDITIEADSVGTVGIGQGADTVWIEFDDIDWVLGALREFVKRVKVAKKEGDGDE